MTEQHLLSLLKIISGKVPSFRLQQSQNQTNWVHLILV